MTDDARSRNKRRLEALKGIRKEVITFDEIQAFIDWLAKRTSGMYNGVYGVPRAGLLLATLYSYRCNVPLLMAPQKGCLVIDDDIGSGLTISAYAGKYDTAVMYNNMECQVDVDYIYAYYTDDVYKVFPWSAEEDLR